LPEFVKKFMQKKKRPRWGAFLLLGGDAFVQPLS
jgi:hypothetical protein